MYFDDDDNFKGDDGYRRAIGSQTGSSMAAGVYHEDEDQWDDESDGE